MSGYIKYFENIGKNMSFLIKDDDFLDKYNEICYKIKETLNMKFHSMPVYDEKYIKAKVREFNSVIKTNFFGDEIPKENVHYTCIACITSLILLWKWENNLEECKYRMKKAKIPKLINTKLDNESESELESDTELESKSELEPDTE